MSNVPIDFSSQMSFEYFNIQPSDVKARCNIGTAYYKRILYNILYSVYEFNIPEEWALNFFRLCLFHFGSIAVIYTKKFGWVALPYSIVTRDLYYQPLEIMAYNRLLKTPVNGIVGVNAGIVKILDDFFGLDDVVTHHATKLANIDKSLDISLMNTNRSLFASASDKKEAEEIREGYAKATAGEPLVIVKKNVLDSDKKLDFLIPESASSYIVDKLLTDRRKIINSFLTIIGVRNSNLDKRERLNSQEVTENNDETRAISSVIIDNINESFEKINKISGLNLSCKLRYNYDISKELDYE